MGDVVHETLVVTSWSAKEIRKAHKAARKLFPDVSMVSAPRVNGYSSFFVPTSGSKAGWEEAREHTEKLDDLCDSLAGLMVEYVRVRYGGDRGVIPVISFSERPVHAVD